MLLPCSWVGLGALLSTISLHHLAGPTCLHVHFWVTCNPLLSRPAYLLMGALPAVHWVPGFCSPASLGLPGIPSAVPPPALCLLGSLLGACLLISAVPTLESLEPHLPSAVPAVSLAGTLGSYTPASLLSFFILWVSWVASLVSLCYTLLYIPLGFIDLMDLCLP